jgi:hypothetical protein
VRQEPAERPLHPTPLRSFQFFGILGVGLVVAVIALIFQHVHLALAAILVTA